MEAVSNITTPTSLGMLSVSTYPDGQYEVTLDGKVIKLYAPVPDLTSVTLGEKDLIAISCEGRNGKQKVCHIAQSSRTTKNNYSTAAQCVRAFMQSTKGV